MKIPEGRYTFDSFVQYLVDNEGRVFGGGERKQWLKVYLVYAQREWDLLFRGFPQTNLGDVRKISMQTGTVAKPVEFYVYEWSPGFLLFFTSSRREDYEKTLRKFIRFNRGITEVWIPPDLLNKVRNRLLSEYQATVYSFISRRSRLSKTAANLRPEFDKRLSYTGEDATEVLKEVANFYGVVPKSISFRVGTDKLQITNSGMLLLYSVNQHSVQILMDFLRTVTEPQRKVREISGQLKRETKTMQIGDLEFRTPVVVPGVITLQSMKLDRYVVERFFGQDNMDAKESSFELEAEEFEPREFSFIDTSIKEGSFSFSALVVDDIKGTMFGLNGSTDQMVLVPMHRTIFESFVRFYKLVIESLDEEAKFDVFPPQTQTA
ncbi:MAG: hypothetical protein ABSD49_09750 [Candidatus Bathyarchaeia archaeon]|jgi:hypothetical protein